VVEQPAYTAIVGGKILEWSPLKHTSGEVAAVLEQIAGEIDTLGEHLTQSGKTDEAMVALRAAAIVRTHKGEYMDPLAAALQRAGLARNDQDAHFAARALRREGVDVTPTIGQRPGIVCLCGSTRFKEAYETATKAETLRGKVVLSVGFFGHVEGEPTADLKAMLDELHLRKIEMADEVFILNVDGYIGKSTQAEIEYAGKIGKVVRYLVPIDAEE